MMELLRLVLVHFLIAIVIALGFIVVPLMFEGARRLVERRRWAHRRAVEPFIAFMVRGRRS
jgi:hypothetical protein